MVKKIIENEMASHTHDTKKIDIEVCKALVQCVKKNDPDLFIEILKKSLTKR